MITAIVMASGFSKRMGKNKLVMDFKGKPLIENVFDEINKVSFKDVVVVSQFKEIRSISEKYGFKYVLNNNAKIGQSESIKLGIVNSLKSDGYMFFVGDQPLIEYKYINKLIEVFYEDKESIIIPIYNDKIGNPVIFPYNKKNELLSLKNNERGKKVIQNTTKTKFVEVSQYMLLDIDTPDDYNKLNALI